MTDVARHVGAISISVVLAVVVGAIMGFPWATPFEIVLAIRGLLPEPLRLFYPGLSQVAMTVTLVGSLGVFYR